MLVRPSVFAGGLQRRSDPGDMMTGSGIFNTLATNGAGTWTGALIAAGIIYRTTVGAGFEDTVDTAQNILTALRGNFPQSEVLPGSSFELLNIVSIAQAMTFGAAVEGIEYGTGPLTNAGSLMRKYLVTILNASLRQSLPCGTTNANKVITFNLQPGQAALPQGIVTPGMLLIGAGITAGTKVVGVTNGLGGLTGVTTDTNSTATAASVALVFSPVVRFDSLGTRGL